MPPVLSCLSDLYHKVFPSCRPCGKAARPVRVVVAGHDLKFMGPYIDYFSTNPRYALRIDEHPGHEIASERQSRDCLDWADVIFCEWAMGNLVWYSRHKRNDQLLFSRLHLQEWQHRDRISYLYDTRWEQVDKLLLTSHHIYDHITDEFPVLRGGRARVLYCPIDAKGRFNRDKAPDVWKRLGIVGIVPQRKRLDLAVAILDALQQVDPEYSLHIKSRRPEEYSWMLLRPEELAWYEEVYARIRALPNPDGVVFEPHGDDMPDWFSTVGYLISTSDFEGSHQAVAESMATGCIPVIRDWEGANRIYPPRFVWSETGEAAELILNNRDENARNNASAFARHYAQDHFDQQRLCRELDALIMRGFERGWPEVVDDVGKRLARTCLPNVLMVGYLPPGYQGGYRVRIEQEIRGLIKWGARVHFACLHPPCDAVALSRHRIELEALGCPVHLVEAQPFFDIALDAKKAVQVLNSLESYARANAVDVSHGQALYSTRIALLLRERMPDLKVVFDCHGISPEEERMGKAAEARVQAIEAWERRALNEADLTIFVSEAMRGHFAEKYGYEKDNRLVLPCCVAEAQFSGGSSPLKGMIPEDRTVVAYTGTLAVWQCGEEMLRLFARLSELQHNLHFLLILPQNDHDQARAWMRQYGLLEEKVTLVELPHDQVASAMQSAHAGVLLRRADPVNRVSSPTKFAEYLAAGLPVLMTSGIGDYSHMTQENGIGCVLEPSFLEQDPFDADGINRLCAFLDHCREHKKESLRGILLVAREHLHWDGYAKSLLRQYGVLADTGTGAD